MSNVTPLPGVELTGEQDERQHKVIPLPCITTLDLNPDQILQAAIGELDCVVILGYDKNGQEYFSGSVGDGGTVLWMMERAKLKLLRTADGDRADPTGEAS